jgi:hypothetical protein
MSNADEIQKLLQLYQAGVLTDEEFAFAKQKVLESESKPESSPFSVLTIVAFVLSIITPLWPITLILCIVALKQIKKSEGRIAGRGLAIAGVVISSIGSLALLGLLLITMPAASLLLFKNRGDQQASRPVPASHIHYTNVVNSVLDAGTTTNGAVASARQDTEKMEYLLRSRFIWINITKAIQDVLAEVTPEIYILSGPDQLELMDSTKTDQANRAELQTNFQPRSVTNATTAGWIESLTTAPPGQEMKDIKPDARGIPQKKPIETIYLRLTAKSIQPRIRGSLNREFAQLLVDRFRAHTSFDDNKTETKLVGGVVEAPAQEVRWFTFNVQLKLVEPINDF